MIGKKMDELGVSGVVFGSQLLRPAATGQSGAQTAVTAQCRTDDIKVFAVGERWPFGAGLCVAATHPLPSGIFIDALCPFSCILKIGKKYQDVA